MITICSRPRNNGTPVILYTYDDTFEDIQKAVILWSVLKDISHRGRHTYLEVDGVEIPADLCERVLTIHEQRLIDATLAAAIGKILDYPKTVAWDAGS